MNAADDPKACVGVVAIGRNEGERLRRCLESVKDRVAAVVYVDSGSADDSVNLARSLGVDVVQLDLSIPFTAARSRNAGVKRLLELKPEVAYVQVVDGDCEVVEGWLDRALMEMRKEGNLNVALVCGRRRERAPDASVYNFLIDMEWNTPIGEAEACGGDALIRIEAFNQVGGYDETLIAGEEPEMCWRMRHASTPWRILRIDAEMTLHDAQLSRFTQWWKRSARSGHAYAEGHALNGHVDGYCGHAVRSMVQWAVVLPLVAIGLAWFTWGASFLLLGLYLVLWARIRSSRIDQHGDSPRDASLYANYCIAGKFAQLQGMSRYWWNRLRGRKTKLLEYKGPVTLAAEGGKS
jgi:GT2 family glycosyltransferase